MNSHIDELLKLNDQDLFYGITGVLTIENIKEIPFLRRSVIQALTGYGKLLSE